MESSAGETQSSRDITRLLQEWSGGDLEAGDRLLPLIYGEMRKIAAGLLGGERRRHTLQPTEVVNEAFLRVMGCDPPWENRSHFFGSLAHAVRRLLVEHARKGSAIRRGGGVRPVTLDDRELTLTTRPDLLVELDAALENLRELDPDLAQVVDLKFFGGLTGEEMAEVLGISTATVTRRWRLARTWLHARLSA